MRRRRAGPARFRRFTPTRVGSMISCLPSAASISVHPHARGEHGRTIANASAKRRFTPHARGEHKQPGRSDAGNCGSPPRAWGAWVAEGDYRPRIRFTPTRVGSMSSEWFQYCWECGSPPRAWGAFPRQAHGGHDLRFTPTRVGSIASRRWIEYLRPVHPHARGEHVTVSLQTLCRAGSPPRAWGALCGHIIRSSIVRFTPTRVGSMKGGYSSGLKSSVHPHARGEHPIAKTAHLLKPGTPPPAWGACLVSRTFVSTCGSPPRAWGALLQYVRFRGFFGSTPRAWGASRTERSVQIPLRFTPTRVGSISRGRLRGNLSSVHPHARGEHGSRWFLLRNRRQCGSPPRAWGA